MTSAQVIKQLQQLETAADAAMEFDRERWRAQLGPILEIWGQLLRSSKGTPLGARTCCCPHPLSPTARRVADATSAAAVEGVADMAPVDQFVIMEHANAAKLVAMVDSGLQAVKKVAFGSGLLTPAIQAQANALLSGSVPGEWYEQWEGPEQPSAWLRGLVTRKVALASWQARVLGGALLSAPLNMAELFNPGTFLNALRQQTARASSAPMDSLRVRVHMRSPCCPASRSRLFDRSRACGAEARPRVRCSL